MAEKSIRQLIIDDIEKTLKGIQESAGYNTSIQKVLTVKVTGMDIKEFPTIIIIPGNEEPTQEPTDRYSAVFNIQLECWVKSKGEIVTKVNQLLADVHKVLMVDYTRDGRAIDTKLMGNEPFYTNINKPYGGVDINIAIEYRTTYADPYVLG